MGFLKRFFRNVFHDDATTPAPASSSFERLSEEELEAHLGVRRYGDFELTVKNLKEKKVKFFKKPKQEPFGKHAIIQDPDGHLVSIAEIEEKSAEGFDLLGLIGRE